MRKSLQTSLQNYFKKTHAHFLDKKKNSKKFAKDHKNQSIEEKAEKIKDVPYMGKPFFDSEGMLVVNAVEYFVDGRYRCVCPKSNRFRNLKASKTYCNCCAGHF